MPTEVEARFRADDPDRLDRLAILATAGGATLGPARAFDETDTYLDTVGGALAVARWACRLRRRGGASIVSLKGPPDAPASGGWLHRRPEVEGPATTSSDPADWPPSAARDLVDRLRGGERLVERLTLEQRRTERRVELDGMVLATLSLDAVRVVRDGTTRATFWVVELELAPDAVGREADLARVAAGIAEGESLLADPLTKLERALELVATP